MTDLVKGIAVYDEAADRFGTIADATTAPGLVFVRPVGGGLEWEARREHLRPATTSELLAQKLRETRTLEDRL